MSAFAAFVARRESEAARAEIAPLVTDLEAPPPGLIAIGNRWTRAHFDGDFYLSRRGGLQPATSLVMVQSKDGNTGAANPADLGGGAADQHLIYEGLSRVAADGVVAGANTIRGSQVVFSVWHPELVKLRVALALPRHPIQIIATLRGLPFETALILNVAELRVILITLPRWIALMHDELAARPWIMPLAIETASGLPAAWRRLREIGVERVSCVGGRTLAEQLMNASLIDEVYLTTSARTGGEPNTPLSPRPLRGRVVTRKHGTRADAGMVFEHIVLSDERAEATTVSGSA